jgi:hypothetical protein
LRGCEDSKEEEEADRKTHLVRAGQGANEQPERSETDGQEGADSQAEEEGGPDDRHPATKHPDVGNAHHKRREPEGQRGDQLSEHDRTAGDRRKQQALQGPPLALPADRVGTDEEGDKDTDRHRDLQRLVDRLSLLEEVDRPIGRGEVGENAEQDTEGEKQQWSAPTQPEIARLLPGHSRPVPLTTTVWPPRRGFIDLTVHECGHSDDSSTVASPVKAR